MRLGVCLSVLTLAIEIPGNAQAQQAGAPLQLAPSGTEQHGLAISAKLPHNWKIISRRPDPLTDKVTPVAMTRPKSTPVINGRSIPAALTMSCNPNPRLSPGPVLVVVFDGLTGVGHFKTFASRYRFDEGAVHDFTATTILGRNHSRAFALPLSTRLDPGVEIAVSKRLRLAVNFQTAGTSFLDFDVSGSPQALAALNCPSGATH
jgi:hypothetical protein